MAIHELTPRSCPARARSPSRPCTVVVAGASVLLTMFLLRFRLLQSSAAEAEEPYGVVLEDLGPHRILDVELLEVGQPAVRLDHREVGAEEDLVLQQRVGVLDQLW